LRVDCNNAQREVRFSINKNSTHKVVEEVLRLEKRACDLISVYFISDKKMRSYHKSLFNDSSATDCITVPLDNNFTISTSHRFLGEIFICPKTALDYVAKKSHLTFWEELSLYLVHGLLHLLGYDDIRPTERALMRRKEKKLLLHLRKNGLLLSGTFR
jgi:probable rRNA maturation factor